MKKISEFEYIKKFSGQFLKNLPKQVTGIGDDCAIIPYTSEKSLLLSTDTLVDTVHFLSHKMHPYDVAYKSLMVNISDIAAMGGVPLFVLLSLAISPDTEINWLDSFFEGLRDSCQKYSVNLIGGDTTKTPGKTVISLTIIGTAVTKNIKYRSSAQIGDLICLTGTIGDSAAGLKCYLEDLIPLNIINCGIKEKAKTGSDIEKIIYAHLRPRPHIEEGLLLSKSNDVNALIDISDGIESDVRRIMENSRCGAEIELIDLPLSSSFVKLADKYGWDCYELAITGGEDYCLMVTIRPDAYQKIATQFKNKIDSRLTVIGEIISIDEGLLIKKNNKVINFKNHGYDHFR